MSAKAIYEFDGKLLISHWLPLLGSSSSSSNNNGSMNNGSTTPTTITPPTPLPIYPTPQMARLAFDVSILTQKSQSSSSDSGNKITHTSDEISKQWDLHVYEVFKRAESLHPWLLTSSLVVKPDQLIKRRGKSGLLGLKLDWEGVKKWVLERVGKDTKVETITGRLHNFLVEPFLPHTQPTEYYICIQSVRDGELIYFTHEGGVDIGDVDTKAMKLLVGIDERPSELDIVNVLLKDVTEASKKNALIEFIQRLFAVYVELQFTYLEINPLVVLETSNQVTIHALDLAAKLDQTAEYECGKKWSSARLHAYPKPIDALPSWAPAMDFPAPFGRELTREEAYIQELDAKTGASLKLTVLNPNGKIWTMVAGGGASVVYSDAIAGAGFAHELANYGEYSGAPSEQQTYEYSKTILDLMTRTSPRPDGKVLFIGGGIANFTNVAATFKGIIRSLKEFQHRLITHKVKIWIRRAGPNFQEGLKMMRQLGETLGIEMHVYGPEMHITGIVPMALKGESADKYLGNANVRRTQSTNSLGGNGSDNPILSQMIVEDPVRSRPSSPIDPIVHFPSSVNSPVEPTSQCWWMPFTKSTRAFIYGMQPRAVQGMLDFDYMCNRDKPSVAAMIYPFGGHHVQKFYWGTKETLTPVYTSVDEAVKMHPEVDTVVNFASCRSVYESTIELMRYPGVKTIAIIAEGVPERRARQLLKLAKQKGILIIGPATVGGIKPGCFKIGNTGGMMDNIVSSKLYRPGSVAYVSKSGGMSNELNNIISRTTDGVYEGVAIGGDRYPGSTFIDHMLRFEEDENAKILVLLGEVGGVEEYEIAKAVKSGKITKPVVAWCIGTCAKMFTTEVQFGHAGACANSNSETADAKNAAMKAAGIIVPDTFEDMPNALSKLFNDLVKLHVIRPRPEPEVPKIPIDYSWAQELGLVRKPASFISTICDDRGQELLYAGMPISEVFKEDIGIGGVLSLLWFKRRLPAYACKFIEMVLMLTADHGPAVSGAHNTIVTARAGKDLVSSLVAGLLTIGDRFGGALDGAAQMFSSAYDAGQSPQDFVDTMRKNHKLILGIGHKIKSRTNPDLRVEIIREFVLEHFPNTDIVKYALEVEKITTAKKDNLILNVDGIVGVAFVDLLRVCGAFSREEADEYVKIGTLNGLFVLGRSIGFIGHYIDQKRLKQGLYRHPWDDISYITPDQGTMLRGANTGAARTFADAKTAIAKGTQHA